ncbi:MAG: winged helix-turn-helix transcriptional regulator [Thermoplasmata archaeon]
MRKSRSEGIGKAFERVLQGEDEEERAGLESVLMSPIRQNLFTYLCKHPGSTLKAIASRNNISQSTGAWHLRQLEGAGYITQKRVRNRLVYFPTGLIDPEDSDLLELLNNEAAKELLLLILTKPGLSQRELAKTLGLSDQSVQRLVRRMEDAGLISRMTDGRFVRYFPSDGLKRAKDRNYRREKEFRRDVLRKMEVDGLSPKVIRQSDSDVLVEVQRSRFKAILEISVDPFRTVLE